MCGVAGFYRPSGLADSADAVLKTLTATLIHRGPDSSGTWIDAGAGIALGHRRLAILDLSEAAHQPMVSASLRFVITFNGEIYNHLELRRALEAAHAAPAWRGHSDTESLLAAIDCWGVAGALTRAAGMFAFALWDRQRRVLTLARDRLGEKPLFYGWQQDTLLFASEIKALLAYPQFRADIDRSAIAKYFQHGYVPAPDCIYKGIAKLTPGCYVEIAGAGPSPAPQPYWSLRTAVEEGGRAAFTGALPEARAELEQRLKHSVAQQSVADVPLGAFLSGGIDSSAVVALMQSQAMRPVQTFTVGFQEGAFQEAEYAKSVAQILGTAHTELYVTPQEAREVIPLLPALYDEPFGDSSAIPTFVVARFARQHVKVCLSGDGGDELFGGYTRYHRSARLWRTLSRIPAPARRSLAFGCRSFARWQPHSLRGWRAGRLAIYLSADTAQECYRASISHCEDAATLVLGIGAMPLAVPEERAGPVGRNVFDAMMYADTRSYLPDDILTKVDRASMGVGLEARVPMLDHRVVEFAWRLPLAMKVHDGRGKRVLRELLATYLPRSLIERPKMGFGVPVGQWVRGPLRDWAEELLAEHRLQQQGFLNATRVRAQWSRHLEGSTSEDDSIWQLLMFQAWLATPQALKRTRAA
jgi:asparagine synthase (glutamine-hydrolysing)